jgi:glutathione S-transferase
MHRVLYTMHYSPWSERARFTLLHHHSQFEEREHTPVLGELALRARAGRYWGRVTVPLLVEDGTAIMDSLAISEHVDRSGPSSRLFPLQHHTAILELNAQLEPMFQAGRARAVRGALTDDDAALDLVPLHLRSLPFARSTGRLGSRFVAWKHPTPAEGIQQRLRTGLEEIRSLLTGRDYVHGDFTYADIIAATAIQLIAPVSDRYIALSPVKRRQWSDPELADEFADLVAWRDELYSKHRPIS